MPSVSDMLTALIQVIMAALGALARMLYKREAAPKLTRTLSDLFVAGFTGLLLYWVASATDIAGGWFYAASGIAGWAGPNALDMATLAVEKKTGIPLNQSVSRVETPVAAKPQETETEG
ncbi:MAG: phage holin family protein [Oscillospiraceae bacterium]|nr:phage holin family protein [Oscillospiraceae bacterium]